MYTFLWRLMPSDITDVTKNLFFSLPTSLRLFYTLLSLWIKKCLLLFKLKIEVLWNWFHERNEFNKLYWNLSHKVIVNCVFISKAFVTLDKKSPWNNIVPRDILVIIPSSRFEHDMVYEDPSVAPVNFDWESWITSFCTKRCETGWRLFYEVALVSSSETK